MPKPTKQRRYVRAVGEAVGACQIVEQGVKLLLESIDLRAGVPRTKSWLDSHHSLGPLIKELAARLPNEDPLMETLRAFLPERNFVAHASIAAFYSGHDIASLSKRVSGATETAYSVWEKIQRRIEDLRDPKRIEQEKAALDGLLRAAGVI
jgi:hypothetical protein